MKKLTYALWMQAVDSEVWRLVGLSVHDLADVEFRSWYDDELSPAEVARMAIEADDFAPSLMGI